MKAEKPEREAERLAALRALEVLDTPREQRFDEIVALAASICDTPVCLISLVEEDRQWFKASVGLGASETPIDRSICAHAILRPGLTVIPDTLADARTADNPLCTTGDRFRFYAGAPLQMEDGPPLGTLCVLDTRSRDLDETQRFALEVLARRVVTELRLHGLVAAERRARALAEEKVAELEEAARLQEVLAGEIDHRVKNSLQMVGAILNLQAAAAPSAEVAGQLRGAADRVRAIAALHDQLHVAARFDRVDMAAFLGQLVAGLRDTAPPGVVIETAVEPLMQDSRRAGFLGIVVNELVTNALKHAFPGARAGRIRLSYGTAAEGTVLEVADDGVGGPEGGVAPTGRSLGMDLVQVCARALSGEFRADPADPGTRCRVLIPAAEG